MGAKRWCSYQRHKVLGTSIYVPPKKSFTRSSCQKLWQPFSCALAIKVFWGVYQTRISMSYSINSCGLFFQRNNLILLRQRLFLFYCLLQFDCTILVLNTHLQAYWIMQNWNFICVCKASSAAWIMTEWGIESMLSGKHVKRKATL